MAILDCPTFSIKASQVSFELEEYIVHESSFVVEVCIVLFGNNFNGGPVTVSTQDGTARGNHYP